MNKLGRAIKETIFQLAVLHSILIVIQAIRTGDYQLVHLASIMDLHFLFKDVSYTFLSNVLYFIPVVILLLVNFILPARKTSQTE